jgi:hypothetical protein
MAANHYPLKARLLGHGVVLPIGDSLAQAGPVAQAPERYPAPARFAGDANPGDSAMVEQPANDDKLQTKGRKANAAQPLDASENEAGAERYPPVKKDDSVEAPPTRPGKR